MVEENVRRKEKLRVSSEVVFFGSRVARVMSHGDSVVAEGKAATTGMFDSVGWSMNSEYQDNFRSLKPEPSYFVEDDDLDQDSGYAWLQGVPSREEVDEATLDLKATFRHSQCNDSCTPARETRLQHEVLLLDTDSLGMTATEPCYDVQEFYRGSSSSAESRTSPLTGSGSVVAQCVDLLQRDPDVQAAVISLATDPAIWNAFVKNEKVQELMRNKHINLPQITETGRNSYPVRIHPILMALCCVRNAVWDMMDTLVDIVSSIFGLVDRKLFGERDSDPVDNPLKACLVLTILVLALVVMKRSSPSTAPLGQPVGS